MTQQANPMTFEAGSDLSAAYLCAVILNSDRQLALPTAGGPILGILQNKPAAQGRAGTVIGSGTGELSCRLGGSVSPGDHLKVDASGRFLLASAPDIAAGAAIALCSKGGAINEEGACVLFAGAAGHAAVTASESPSGVAGNYNLDASIEEHRLTLGTANRTGVLADGKYVGQKHLIRAVADSGGFTYALTPTTMAARGTAAAGGAATGHENSVRTPIISELKTQSGETEALPASEQSGLAYVVTCSAVLSLVQETRA
jgi:hypothetical protein